MLVDAAEWEEVAGGVGEEVEVEVENLEEVEEGGGGLGASGGRTTRLSRRR